MTEASPIFFKQVVHANINLALLVVVAWVILGRGRAAATTLAVWSVLLIRALAEPLLCPERAALPHLDFSQQGFLGLSLSAGWGERTVSVLLGIGGQAITAGDLAVLSLGETAAAFLGASLALLLGLNLVVRLIALWQVRGTGGEIVWSDGASTPHIRGWKSPSIVIPRGLKPLLTSEEMRAVVAHEKAHLHRYDHWWFALFFLLRAFCPVVWPLTIILNSLEQSIERLCDKASAREVGALITARALLKVAELQRGLKFHPQPVGFPHFSRHPVVARVSALRRLSRERESWLLISFSLLLVAVVIL